MSEPFLAEIRLFGFNFPPRGWAQCDGVLLPINQNQSLYSLLGSTYGGDGRTTFGLPDLRGRAPIHVNNSHPLGQKSGEETVPLTEAELPSHAHTIQATSDNASGAIATDNLWANAAQSQYHTYDISNAVSMASGTLAKAGDGEGRENMQPFLAVNFCIAITGTFPPRN